MRHIACHTSIAKGQRLVQPREPRELRQQDEQAVRQPMQQLEQFAQQGKLLVG